jgi:hypothetical protein
MKKIALALAVLVVAGIADAQNPNIPSGMTGLWRFQNSADKLKATVGYDLVNSTPDNANWMTGPWTVIMPNLGLSDGGIIQDRSWDYLSVNPNFTANGGGSYVNQYTVLVDFKANPGWNSLFQTAWGGNDNDGDLWIDAATQSAAKIGVGGVGYSTMTFDATSWHRLVWSVDNGNFFRVYVDGALYLDGTAQAVDGRFSLYPDRFNLFADNDWEDAWCLAGMAATWGRALSTAEIAAMGGWVGGAAEPTPLIPEPTTMSLLALAGLFGLIRRIRK